MQKKGFFLTCLILILSSLFCFSFSAFLEATPPEIYSITPDTGHTVSSTQVTINGAGFQPASKASLFGGDLSITGAWDAPGSAEDIKDIHVKDNFAYVTDGHTGLKIIDISNPSSPSVVGTCITPGSAKGLYIQGTYAYVADNFALKVMDISNPTSPSIIGSRDTPGSANAVYVQSKYAYVADGSSGLQVIDISNPAKPSIVGKRDTPGSANAIYVQGTYAYVADESSGLQVIDINNPAKPSIAGSCLTLGYAWGVHVRGSYAYVTDGYKGLKVIDISNPAKPSIVGLCDTPGSASSLYIEGEYAYVADTSELQVIDISNPAKPSIAGSCLTPGSAISVYVQEPYAYVADRFSGLQVIEILKHLAGVIYMDSNTLKVTIPSGFTPDTYSVYITNPDGGQAVLHNAFTIKGIEIYFSAGLNIFGYPVKVNQGITSYDLIDILGKKDEICNIQRYDPDTKSYEITAYDPNGTHSGKEFNIVSGEGYIVNMKAAKSASFVGTIPNTAISCDEGFNIISIPNIPAGYTSYNLLSYLGFSSEIASITRFNSEMGIYETTSYYYGKPSGIEFDIINGEAYMIYMKVVKNKDVPQ